MNTCLLFSEKVCIDYQQRKKGAHSIYSGTLVGNDISIPLVSVYKSASVGSHVVIENQVAVPIPEAWRKVFFQFKAYIKAEGAYLSVKNSHAHLLPQALTEDTTKKLLPLPQPKNATFRPYQRVGIRWLQKSHLTRSGVLLADDMGLGKTLQVLSFLNFLKQEGKLVAAHAIQQLEQLSLFDTSGEENGNGSGITLVLVPVSLLFNWYNEGQKFYPNIRMYRYYGTKRQEFASALHHNEVILTSYSTFRNDFEKFKKLPISVLVLDEAHVLKNSASKTHQFVRQLQPEFSIALSGTPIENSASDYGHCFASFLPTYLELPRSLKDNFQV
jgi:SNF2 family DNA or RNA helicase